LIRPKLRFATNADAKDIKEILDQNGQIPNGHDWSEIGPEWIVAEYDETIVGCCSIYCGKPFGHMGFLAVLPGYFNSGVGAYLWRAAERVLANNGCDGYTATTDNKDIIKKLPKIGGIIFKDPVNMVFKRVYRGQRNGQHQQER
jgi:N-acetylglutamate synthase-like GNAT family acetyltransferase